MFSACDWSGYDRTRIPDIPAQASSAIPVINVGGAVFPFSDAAKTFPEIGRKAMNDTVQ